MRSLVAAKNNWTASLEIYPHQAASSNREGMLRRHHTDYHALIRHEDLVLVDLEGKVQSPGIAIVHRTDGLTCSETAIHCVTRIYAPARRQSVSASLGGRGAEHAER